MSSTKLLITVALEIPNIEEALKVQSVDSISELAGCYKKQLREEGLDSFLQGWGRGDERKTIEDVNIELSKA